MKRDKTIIWRSTLSLMVFIMVISLTFSACTKEPLWSSMSGGDGVEVSVTFPKSVTRATTASREGGTDSENRLDHVTIFIFNHDGTKLETVLSEDVTTANSSLSSTQPKWVSNQTLVIRPVINPSKPKRIYAVANWSKVDFDKNKYTDEMLKEELITIISVADINGNAASPMLMSGSQSVTNLASLSYSVSMKMERQLSKISTLFTMPKSVQNSLSNIEWQTDLMKMMVVNVPNKSYIVARGYSPKGANLLNSDLIDVDDSKPLSGDQTVPASSDLVWRKNVYITEHFVDGIGQAARDASTYIVVQLPYKNRVTNAVMTDNYYKLYINDLTPSEADSPHRVLRNTIYNFEVIIAGLGLPINDLVSDVNIDAQLTVNSWEKGEIGDIDFPNNKFFSISNTRIEFKKPAETAFVFISTNVLNWKLVATSGKVILDSSPRGTVDNSIDGIDYSLSRTASAAIIYITNKSRLQSIPTQQMFFIANSLKIPFSVAYNSGLIAKSVLPPSWTEGEKKITMQWDTTDRGTVGDVSEKLSSGISNRATIEK